ncbi:MAG: glutaredoxin family protein [Candidatus Altiarchaeia archaeon]
MDYEKYIKKMPGSGKKTTVFLFTLSTCIWCKKTKALLKELGIEYSYVDVDLVGPDARERVLEDFSRYNKLLSYPTIVLNGGETVIVGFEEDRIKGILKNGR